MRRSQSVASLRKGGVMIFDGGWTNDRNGKVLDSRILEGDWG